MLIAGDVGGTNTRLAVHSVAKGPHEPLFEAEYSSWAHDSLESLLRHFLGQMGPDLAQQISCAVLGIPGPVVEGRATGTNLPWIVDQASVRVDLGLRWVRLINDLQAIAWSVPSLQGNDLRTVVAGQPEPRGTIAVIAPGTGLGEAFLLWDDESTGAGEMLAVGGDAAKPARGSGRHPGYRPRPSEGGHADFAPNGDEQIELARYLQRRHGHVSYERVCSGRGLPNIYAFLRDTGRASEPAWLAEKLAAAQDITPIIVSCALCESAVADRAGEGPTPFSAPVPLCRRALGLLVDILAAEAGNMALRLMATGGVYLGGGMPRHLLPLIASQSFATAFRGKGRLSYLLESLPVYVIMHPLAGRLGAAYFGLQLLTSDATGQDL